MPFIAPGHADLLLALIRLVNRQLQPLPPFLPTMSARERLIATASERLLYGLMLLLPLVGWGMLSAARLPVRVGPVVLPPILPHSVALYTLLRRSHTVLAYLLFFAFMAHLSAVLFLAASCCVMGCCAECCPGPRQRTSGADADSSD